MDRGKRLSRGNIIGKQGELAFEQWALDHQLSPNKADIDIGLDYFCQLMFAVAGSKSLEGKGPVVGAQVKSVDDADRPRLRLTRIDAIDLLRQTHPTCVFGVRLSDKSIRFQFLTKDFIDFLLDYLESNDDTVSVPYADMSEDAAHFHRLLRKYASPFEQLQLRIHLIQRRMRKEISGANLSVESTDEGTVCRIYVPWASSAFSVDPSIREKIRLNVLRGGVIDSRAEGVGVHPAILAALNETQSSRLILSGRSAERVTVGVCWQDKKATEPFERHVYGNEVAYVHRAGLRLSYDTRPEKKPDGYFHTMESEIFRPPTSTPLTGNVLVFLRLFRPSAVLSLRPDWHVPISAFGEDLDKIGDAIGPIPDLCKSLGLPLKGVGLADVADEEFARTTQLLEAVLIEGVTIEQLVSGFIVGPAADLPIEQVPTNEVSISVPIVLNWKDRGVVIWAECIADGFLHEGLLCGIRVTQQRSWRIEITDRFSKSKFPELWVAKAWPAIPIGSGVTGKQSWTYDPAQTRPLEATIKERD